MASLPAEEKKSRLKSKGESDEKMLFFFHQKFTGTLAE